MKSKLQPLFISLALSALSTLNLQLSTLHAQGTILGKAMTGLSEGKGTVLVLATLQ
jgi:hypothetical protein